MASSTLLFLCRKRYCLQICCAVFLTCLAACSNDDFSDLNQYISRVKAEPKGAIKPLPEINVIEPFMFNPEGLRDPFKPLVEERKDAEPKISPICKLKPDTSRRKDDLEAFPLETLKMVGTVIMKSNLWGLVKADNGTIYRVQVGNYMGKNFGEIIRISADKIELMEIVSDGTCWREQPATLGRLFLPETTPSKPEQVNNAINKRH